MDSMLKCQNAIHRFLDVSDIESKSRYLLLNDAERAEVQRWVDLLATGLLVTVQGQPDPVQVDVELCTSQIRAVWDASIVRRQNDAAAILKSAGVPEMDALDTLDSMLSG